MSSLNSFPYENEIDRRANVAKSLARFYRLGNAQTRYDT